MSNSWRKQCQIWTNLRIMKYDCSRHWLKSFKVNIWTLHVRWGSFPTFISRRTALLSCSPGSLNMSQSCLYWKYLQRRGNQTCPPSDWLWTWKTNVCFVDLFLTHLATGSVFFLCCWFITGLMTETDICGWIIKQFSVNKMAWYIRSALTYRPCVWVWCRRLLEVESVQKGTTVK